MTQTIILAIGKLIVVMFVHQLWSDHQLAVALQEWLWINVHTIQPHEKSIVGKLISIEVIIYVYREFSTDAAKTIQGQ